MGVAPGTTGSGDGGLAHEGIPGVRSQRWWRRVHRRVAATGDLTRASHKEFAKLLVAGRVDAGGLRVSRREVERFAAERKFRDFLETSEKQNLGCEELKQAILAGINCDEIPCRTTEVLFKRLREEVIRLKDEGRVLMRFSELRETLQLRLSGEFKRFADEELRAVLTLLAGPGVV